MCVGVFGYVGTYECIRRHAHARVEVRSTCVCWRQCLSVRV